MNCSVCGGPLLFDRVVFRCSCGTYVHAYCADRHILQAHRPEFVEGRVDLNGEFHLKNEPVEAPVPTLKMPAEIGPEAEEAVLANSPLPEEEELQGEEEEEGEEDLEPDEEELAREARSEDDPGQDR